MGLSDSVIPEVEGTLIFDDKKNIIDATDIGEQRLKEITDLLDAKLNADGYGFLEDDHGYQVQLWGEDDKRIALFIKKPDILQA
ncbi:hypothetical protein NCAS_0D04640 [Naumovozyma castellii]|uniref:Uncharacterized protein n=1 Tax=Naumovozyma castellii TaxID=27288 RepID=G0VEQ4_NAUCA|nr:hypothetical protein NCAS_0D04640 [Naumovozyma castellii CBS 4309]CCC70045.1 hypothetical protein NCAS_0D04640 [Naumovozyma castellii CBS 4309]